MPVIEYLRLGKDLPTETGAQTGRGIEPHFTLEMETTLSYGLCQFCYFIPSAGKADGSLLPLAEAAERSILTLPRWAPISANPR